MKCIVIQTSPERISAEPVTNENGTPHIYATISEARAELKANGYSYNRANDRYYIKGTEYRAYIIREDSEEYARTIENTEIDALVTPTNSEHIQTVSGHKIYRSIDPVTGWNVFTVAGRDFWELAEARYFAQCNPTDAAETAEQAAADAAERIEHDATAHQWSAEETAAEIEHRAAISAANRAALALLDAYADAIGDVVTDDDPEAIAARQVAREAIGHATATEEQRATVDAMVQAIADRWTQDHEPEPALVYQRAELEAFLGDYADAYDVSAIEAEATEYDPKTGRTVWTPEAVRDLWSICERHELYSYAPAI